jgi:hypothetical protein
MVRRFPTEPIAHDQSERLVLPGTHLDIEDRNNSRGAYEGKYMVEVLDVARKAVIRVF